MKYEPITIITAELPSLDYYTNTERTGMLRLNLLDMGFSIVGVRVNDRQGFIVVSSDYKSLQKLAQTYNQDSIIVSDESRQTKRISTLEPQTEEDLGKLLNCNKHDKMSLGDLKITFIEDGKRYVFSTEQ